MAGDGAMVQRDEKDTGRDTQNSGQVRDDKNGPSKKHCTQRRVTRHGSERKKKGRREETKKEGKKQRKRRKEERRKKEGKNQTDEDKQRKSETHIPCTHREDRCKRCAWPGAPAASLPARCRKKEKSECAEKRQEIGIMNRT